MQCVKLISFACLSFFVLLSCSNNVAATTTEKKNSADDPVASPQSSQDKSTFSYNLDGVKISGGSTDITQFNNSAQVVKGTDNPDRVQFFLNDGTKEDAQTFPHSLRFVIPAKSGTTTLNTDEANWNVGLFVADKDDKYVMYQNESFRITITGISASRVSGTFSGKLKLMPGQTGQKNEVTITDGQFDIPVRK